MMIEIMIDSFAMSLTSDQISHDNETIDWISCFVPQKITIDSFCVMIRFIEI